MDKEQALAFCYRNRDEYIKGFERVDEGLRQFDCLVALLEDGTVTPDQLGDYGMSTEEGLLNK